MKKSQRDTYTPSEDFEDLTLFANESFDTQDVDLFEFTSEESSPLTRLKSIILSLDWEINDEILQELADELVSLQSMWQDDKVAEVYLQGLAKIGNYIRTKGAYAHPNSIKLLLTFFYNFEKIISSPSITGDQITQLLKGDVRKFKILQYQITQSESPVQEETSEWISPPLSVGQPVADSDEPPPAQQLKAAILGLDWEVTEESLMQFNATLLTCHQHMTGNKAALVLLQGLQALGDYIAEERANSHPDAFSLLHAFDEALGQVGESGEGALDQSEVQDLLVDRINRLNSLKMVIASPQNSAVDEQLIAGVVDEISSPVSHDLSPIDLVLDAPTEQPRPTTPSRPEVTETSATDTAALGAELDSIFGLDSAPLAMESATSAMESAIPAMETADVQYPDEILSPDAIQPVDDELADDLIGAELNTKRGLTPALADSDEEFGFSVEETAFDLPIQDDLAAQLDFLFADSDEPATATPPAEVVKTDAVVDTPEFESAFSSEPIAALSDVEPDADGRNNDVELEPALGQSKSQPTDFNSLEIESKLDSFFADADADADAGQAVMAENAVEEIEQSLFFDEPTSPAAALSESDEQGGFSEEEAVASLGHSPLDEIEEKLDFFFGDENEAIQAEDSIEQLVAEELSAPEPALSDLGSEQEEEDGEPVAALANLEPANELDGALDLFFADAEQPVTAQEDIPEELLVGSATENDTFFLAESEEAVPVIESLATVAALTSAVEQGVAIPETDADDEERQIHLAALGAVLPLAVRSLARDQISQSQEMLGSLLQSGISAEHRAVGQLLQSVLTMLARLPAKDEDDTERLVNYLYEQLLSRTLPPAVPVEAIALFNTWLQQASILMPLVPSAVGQKAENTDPQYNYTAKELYFELAELRLHMREEFAKIRHELQHHH